MRSKPDQPSSKLARMAKSLVATAAMGSLVLFIGAARPIKPRKVSIPTMPRPTRTVSVTLAPAALPAELAPAAAAAAAAAEFDQAAELLEDARPAVAILGPSTEISKRPRVMRMEVTAYCACTKCCGPKAQGITASGLHVSHNEGKFVAADTDVLPMYTKIIIPGYDARPVPVIDRGGAIKGHKLDLYFPTHEEALEWGRQWVDVTVIE
jgi:3D (Asp-Asp-Asp) domain-containing protein